MTTTLTGNEVAIACNGLAHMLNFLATLPASRFRREEVAKAKALNAKLSGLLDERCKATYDKLCGVEYGHDDGEAIILCESKPTEQSEYRGLPSPDVL